MDLVWDAAWQRCSETTFASTSQDGTVQLWDVRKETPGHGLAVKTSVLSIDWNPSEKSEMSLGLDDGRVLTYDIRMWNTPLAARVRDSVC